jgi:hypothetical protein
MIPLKGRVKRLLCLGSNVSIAAVHHAISSATLTAHHKAETIRK